MDSIQADILGPGPHLQWPFLSRNLTSMGPGIIGINPLDLSGIRMPNIGIISKSEMPPGGNKLESVSLLGGSPEVGSHVGGSSAGTSPVGMGAGPVGAGSVGAGAVGRFICQICGKHYKSWAGRYYHMGCTTRKGP